MMTQEAKKDRRQFQVAKRDGDGMEIPATASAGGQGGFSEELPLGWFFGGEKRPAMQRSG